MSGLERSNGNRSKKLGARERKILLAMLELDGPDDSPIFWDQILRRLGIELTDTGFVTRDEQYKDARLYKKAMNRLVRRGYAKVVILGNRPPPRRYGFQLYKLTDEGRRVAAELKGRMEAREDLEAAIKALADQDHQHATLNQIREALWQISHQKFSGREDFEKFWSRKRLGSALKKLGIKRVLRGPKNRRVAEYILRVK